MLYKCKVLLLVDIFEIFPSKVIEVHELDLAYFLLRLGLTWQACIKRKEVTLELQTEQTKSLYLINWNVNNLYRKKLKKTF